MRKLKLCKSCVELDLVQADGVSAFVALYRCRLAEETFGAVKDVFETRAVPPDCPIVLEYLMLAQESLSEALA